MENLIILGLAAAVLLTAAAGAAAGRPQPPPIIYIQTLPEEPQGNGCLPLLLLVGAILAALAFT